MSFVSFVNVPVTFTIAFTPVGSTGAQNMTFGSIPFSPNSSTPGISGPTPPYDEAIHQFLGARGIVHSFRDYCSTTGPFANAFTVTAMIGASGPFNVGTLTYTFSP